MDQSRQGLQSVRAFRGSRLPPGEQVRRGAHRAAMRLAAPSHMIGVVTDRCSVTSVVLCCIQGRGRGDHQAPKPTQAGTLPTSLVHWPAVWYTRLWTRSSPARPRLSIMARRPSAGESPFNAHQTAKKDGLVSAPSSYMSLPDLLGTNCMSECAQTPGQKEACSCKGPQRMRRKEEKHQEEAPGEEEGRDKNNETSKPGNAAEGEVCTTPPPPSAPPPASESTAPRGRLQQPWSRTGCRWPPPILILAPSR